MKLAAIIGSILPGKRFSAGCLIVLLLLLTGINFVIYADNSCQDSITWADSNNSPEESESGCPGSPAGPDEKSPNAPVSINEEYIHEHAGVVNPFSINPLFEHKIHEAEKLCVVHFDLFVPPPEA
jgi:hypothetical protein